jgi:Leucine-rich repeat (LRR) protein
MSGTHAGHAEFFLRSGRHLCLDLLLWLGASSVLDAVPVQDPQLQAALLCALGKTNGQITADDLPHLTSVSAVHHEISSLAGLEAAINLTELHLDANSISDLAPLQSLTNLASLTLENNLVTNVSPLAGLTNLDSLAVSANPVGDYSPLAGLSRLARLSLHDGGVTNLTFLQNLQALKGLNLYNNRFQDISGLQSLTNLNCLDLRWNVITNPAVLAQATNLNRLYLGGNGLTNVDFLANLTGLTCLNLDQNQIQIWAPLIALTNLTYLVVSHNPGVKYGWLSALTNLVNLELRGNSVGNISFFSQLGHLRYADLAYNNITDLSPLAGLTNLSLVLDANTNLNYLAFSNLTNLCRVWLNHNSITNVSFLTNQTRLCALGLEHNAIADLSPLTNLALLSHLGLSRNSAFNAGQLSALANLSSLRLEGNCISNVSFLSNLSRLSFLSLQSNLVSDLSPLAPLTNLTSLYLPHNRLTNINSLPSLSRLRYVDVSLELCDMTPGSPAKSAVQEVQCQGANATYLPTNQLVLSVPAAPDWYVPVGRTRVLNFFVSDQVVPENELSVTASSSTQAVLPSSSMSLDGTNGNRTLTVTAGVAGTSILTLSVMDAPGGLTASNSLTAYAQLLDPNFAIADPALAATISGTLGVPAGDLTSVDLLELSDLDASAKGITNLAGLEWASNLTGLNLGRNSIRSLLPLQNLTNLIVLSLFNNQAADPSPLAKLTSLSSLDLSLNPLTNSAALSGLTNLTTLNLAATATTNLSFLTNLTEMVSLNLATNKLTDISPLAALTNLNWLYLQQNRLTDISFLTNLRSHLINLNLSLNLLVTNDPVLALLANVLNPPNPPQRGLPLIDVRTNWVIAPNLTSSLPFTISDTGPADQQFGFSIASNTPNLVCTAQGGPVLWNLAVTPVGFLNGTNNLGWITLAATNDVGIRTNTTITVEGTPLLPVTGPLLGDPNLTWSSGGDLPWSVQNLVTHNGYPVAQSGALANNQESWLQTTVSGPGILTFWWKVSSEACCDKLRFTIGNQTVAIAGEIDWQFQEFFVPPGTQTLFWRYSKDAGVSDGLDAGWLDQVSFQPGTWVTFLDGPAGGETDLILYGVPGRVYELQASTNLQSWFGLRPLVVGAAPYILFTDTNASSDTRLYRLKDFSVTLDPPLLPINNSAQLVVHNLSGLPYDLQVSTDLLVWNTFATVTNTTRDVTNIDIFATNSPVRFYRAVVHP